MRPAGALSFHLAFWPGLVLGVMRSIETFAKITLFPSALALGSGQYALDLGLNVYGLLVSAAGYLAGAVIADRWRAGVAHAR
jgi:hypothetical protein